MTKATEMAKISAKGGFHLLWGLVTSTVISAVGTIVIARLLGPANYGLYAIALTAPNLISTFRDWGITNALVKYSAQYKSEKNTAKIRSIFVSSFMFEIILGLSLSIISFTLSGFLASSFNRPNIAPLIQIASFFILTGALVTTATEAFTGLETMHLNSIMLILQSILKTGLIIGFVLLGLGTFGAVTGFTVAVFLAGLIGLFLVWIMYRSLPKPSNKKLEIISTIKTMLSYGLPLSIGAILVGFWTQFSSYILAIYVSDNAIIGNYNIALNFVVLITFVATPVTTMLFPAFSKLDPDRDKETLRNVFRYSVKYAALIVVPVTTMIITLARPAISTIFQENYTQAPLFLALLSILYLFSAIGSLSTVNLINAQGYTRYILKLSVLSVIVGFPLSYLLISNFGVIGIIVATLTIGLLTPLISLRFVKKHFAVSVDWGSSAKILFSSTVPAILTYITISQLAFTSLIQLIIGIIIYLVTFSFIALITRTVNKEDLTNLREIVKALGPLQKLFHPILNLADKFITRMEQRSSR